MEISQYLDCGNSYCLHYHDSLKMHSKRVSFIVCKFYLNKSDEMFYTDVVFSFVLLQILLNIKITRHIYIFNRKIDKKWNQVHSNGVNDNKCIRNMKINLTKMCKNFM